MAIVFVIARDWTLRTAVRAECDPAVQKLIERVPTVLIASRTETLPLQPARAGDAVGRPRFAAIFYRPVRIAEIVARVRELLERGTAA